MPGHINIASVCNSYRFARLCEMLSAGSAVVCRGRGWRRGSDPTTGLDHLWLMLFWPVCREWHTQSMLPACTYRPIEARERFDQVSSICPNELSSETLMELYHWIRWTWDPWGCHHVVWYVCSAYPGDQTDHLWKMKNLKTVITYLDEWFARRRKYCIRSWNPLLNHFGKLHWPGTEC